jgi:hypothetical protein
MRTWQTDLRNLTGKSGRCVMDVRILAFRGCLYIQGPGRYLHQANDAGVSAEQSARFFCAVCTRCVRSGLMSNYPGKFLVNIYSLTIRQQRFLVYFQ